MLRTAIIISTLIIICVVAGLLLVPAREELEHMKAESLAMPERKAHYEKRVAEGMLLPVIVKPLVEIYIQNKELDKAIALQEKFIEARPKEIEAYEKLAELYMAVENRDKQAETIEKAYLLNAAPKYLEILSGIYNYQKNYEKQLVVLKKLYERDPTNKKYATDLAEILLLNGKYAEADAALEGLTDLPFSIEKIRVFTKIKDGKEDEAFNMAKILAKKNLQPKEVAELAGMFNAERSLELIDISGQKPESDSNLLAMFLRAKVAKGEYADAYSKMKELKKAGTFPEELFELYVDEAMRQQDRTELRALFTEKSPEILEPKRLLNLLIFSSNNIDELMENLSKKLSPEYIDANPVIAAYLALQKDTADIYSIMEKAAASNASHEEKIILAEIAHNKGFEEWTLYFLDHLKPYNEVPKPLLERLAYLFVNTKKEKEGLEEFNKMEKSVQVERGIALMSARKGAEAEVIKWLETAGKENITEGFLNDLFYISSEGGNTELALKTAEMLNANYPSDKSKYNYGEALLKSGKPLEALEYLRDYQDDPIYLDALYAAVKINPELKQELVGRLKEELGKADSKRQKELVQALIENGAAEDVLDNLESFAFKNKGNWIFLYEETLKKQEKKARLENFYSRLIADKSLSAKERRRIAYLLLESGKKYEAEEAFFKLASTSGPESKDVEQLIYLWGAALEPDQISWLAARAENAPANEKNGWIKLLLENGGSAEAVKILEKSKSKDLKLYTEALARTASDKEMEKFLKDQIDKTNKEEVLEYLGKIAMGRELYSTAQAAYSRIPDNKAALKNLGIISYEAGDQKKAKQYLERYAAKDGNEYLPLFYLAEITENKSYYEKAIADIKSKKEPNPAEQEILISSLYRLKRDDEADLEKRELLKKHPNDIDVNTGLAYSLINNKKYDSAAALIKRGKYSLDLSLGYATRVRGTDISKIRTTDKPHEIVFYYDKPIDESKAAKDFLNNHPNWINSVSKGYDYLYLKAEPGWEFTYTIDVIDNIELLLKPSKQTELVTRRENFIQIEMLNARLERETGKSSEAKERLKKLNTKYPEEPTVSSALASEEVSAGRTYRAKKLSETTTANNKENSWLKEGIAEARAPKVQVLATYIDRENRREYITEAKGSIQANEKVRIGAEVAINNASTDDGIQLSNGDLSKTEKTKFRGETYAEYQFDNGVISRTSLYANNRTLGVGQKVSVENPLGETDVMLEYQKPNWDFTEGVLDDATRDSIGFLHRFRNNHNLPLFISASLNNYSVEDERNAAQSVKTGGGIRVPLNDLFSLGYTLDAEYRTYAKRGVNVLGNSYALHPLVTREVHFGDISINYDIFESLKSGAFLGYAYDRLGGEGVGFGGSLDYTEGKWKAGANASHSLSTTSTKFDENRFNLFVERKF